VRVHGGDSLCTASCHVVGQCVEQVDVRVGAQNALTGRLALVGGPVAGLVSGNDYESYKSFAAQDAAFHLAVATASGVTLMVEMIERLRPHAQLYRLYYTVGIADDTVREHQRVLDAVARRDDAGAAQAMSAHLRASRAGWPVRPAGTSDRIRVAGRYPGWAGNGSAANAASTLIVFTS